MNRLIPGHYTQRLPVSPNSADWEFVGSVEKHGVISDLYVCDIENSDEKKIFCGDLRLDAAVQVGIKELNCRVYPSDMPESVRMVFALVDNIQRKNLTPPELGAAIYKLWKLLDQDTNFVAREIGYTPTMVKHWIETRAPVEALIRDGIHVENSEISLIHHISGKLPDYRLKDVFEQTRHMGRKEARKTIKLLDIEINKKVNKDVSAAEIANAVKAGRPVGTSMAIMVEDPDLAWAIETASKLDHLNSKVEYLLALAKKDVTAKGIYPVKMVEEVTTPA